VSIAAGAAAGPSRPVGHVDLDYALQAVSIPFAWLIGASSSLPAYR
jgi:hypothetical protein